MSYIIQKKKVSDNMKFDINRVKIFVIVPIDSTDKVRDAACEKGAGVIGNYSYCTTSYKVIGTFIPNDGANPYIGSNNQLEIVEEEKIEFVCDIRNAKDVIKEIRRVHPYEEPAIDIVPLIDEKDLLK